MEKEESCANSVSLNKSVLHQKESRNRTGGKHEEMCASKLVLSSHYDGLF
jgi:hypothetical protein